MAKLKVFKKKNGSFTDFDTQGYINVVQNLVETQNLGVDPPNLTNFLAATPKNRSDMLQDFANPAGTPSADRQYQVQQLANDGTSPAISSHNCKIQAEKDVKQPNGNFSKVTMPIPDAAIKDFTYLKGYVDGIISEYMVCLNPDEKDETLKRFKYNDDPHRLRTYKFMFGVMMLTRCR